MNTQCLTCLPGFTLNPTSFLCIANNCTQFNQQGFCTQCGNSLTLRNNICVLDCATYTPSGTCECCPLGKTLSAATGTCDDSSKYCAQPTGTNGSCARCVDGYTLVAGICMAPTPNCRTPSLQGCSSCNPGYEVVGCKCKAKFCSSFNPDGSCSQCRNSRFELSSGTCTPRDCQFFSNSTTWSCVSCYSSFNLTADACVSNGCNTFTDSSRVVCSACSSPASYDLLFGGCYIKFC